MKRHSLKFLAFFFAASLLGGIGCGSGLSSCGGTNTNANSNSSSN